MTASIIARAPGKLFLLGEYAVLDGCSAVVAAVDRHVEARIELGGRHHRVRISAPALDSAVEFHPGASPSPAGPLRFALAAYAAAVRALPELSTASLDVTIDSRLVSAAGTKTGLGGSAAVSVAVTAGLFATAGADTAAPSGRDRIFAAALEAHRTAQGGCGSGADVAASVHGGIVHFRPRAGAAPVVGALHLPPHTELLAGWSGEAASTPDSIERYIASTDGLRRHRTAFVETVRVAVADFADERSAGARRLAAVDRNGDALEALGTQLGIPLMTRSLHHLTRIARAHGAAAKISGAGGGDCGIALAPSDAATDRIRAAWRKEGISPLDLRVDPQGVNIRHE